MIKQTRADMLKHMETNKKYRPSLPLPSFY